MQCCGVLTSLVLSAFMFPPSEGEYYSRGKRRRARKGGQDWSFGSFCTVQNKKGTFTAKQKIKEGICSPLKSEVVYSRGWFFIVFHFPTKAEVRVSLT